MPDTTPTNGTQDQQTETIETAEATEATVPDLDDTFSRLYRNQDQLVCILDLLLMASPTGFELGRSGLSGLTAILNDIAEEYSLCFRDIERIHGRVPEDEE